MATYKTPSTLYPRVQPVQSTQLEGITNLALLGTIEDGFIDSLAAVTHVQRSQAVLKTLQAVRLTARESQPRDSPEPDFVGKLEIVHFFRFGVIPADLPRQSPNEPTVPARMYLNVTFDGGWEPYMRFIWRDLGALLDLILCSCTGYPTSRDHSYDDYIRWVRAHEVAGGFFYADSAMTVSDQQRLRQAASQRNGPPLISTDPKVGKMLLLKSLKLLEALHGLYPLFVNPRDSLVLRRAADDLLGPVAAATLRGLLNDPTANAGLIAAFKSPLEWFKPAPDISAQAVDPLPAAFAPKKDDIQGGILTTYTHVSHGCLVLLRLVDPADPAKRDQARRFLAGYKVDNDDEKTQGKVMRNVALTRSGLDSLGVASGVIDLLPQEFLEGMEARAGALGDFGVNHPQNWELPERNWPPSRSSSFAKRVDLAMVHVVVQIRAYIQPVTDLTLATLPPGLVDEIDALQAGTGLEVLSVQPMYRNEVAPGITRDHFGFADGFSQPRLDAATPAPAHWSDQVQPGEVLLGHPNQRGDKPAPHPFFDNGTFLAIRKLQQNIGALNKALGPHGDAVSARPAAVAPSPAPTPLEQMVGRRRDGTPLVLPVGPAPDKNDFDFAHDSNGAQCPFQSHVRRTNPRKNLPHAEPRIVRRGMSYGPQFTDPGADPAADRGTVFMAYGASLAEQFEVIQRWIAGGNSTGQQSTQRDPLLGIPTPGEAHRFTRLVDGAPQTLDLGSEPFVRLMWGLYAFVPSLSALKSLGAPLPAAGPAPIPPKAPPSRTDLAHWQRRLEDRELRDGAWAEVRTNQGSQLATDYGLLLGSKADVMGAFQNAGGQYSVCGYGARMTASLGLGYLGMDQAGWQAAHADDVNSIIQDVTEEEAHDAARERTAFRLARRLQGASVLTGEAVATVNLSELADEVLGDLCTHWFGLPDGVTVLAGGSTSAPSPHPTCPAHLASVSRYVFSPRPSALVAGVAQSQGKGFLTAVKTFLGSGEVPPESLTAKIVLKLRAHHVGEPEIASTVAGIMLGFAPTVFGNMRSVIEQWVPSKQVLRLQQRLADELAANASATEHTRAHAVLRDPMLRAMLAKPVPDMLWRKKLPVDGSAPANVSDPDVVLGTILFR